ncbi:alpha/beta fold hydrolase [Nonomuraea soli]|uniref:Pimeloyl-ACP methyl ester carboxylesterase n=1 Tax=Nonomuraea soli TaxID=1032476 RepID=A0A7W0CUS9_9ACTN|nr:alpha/beta hydrolase [Nonomuraea soli]MBA2897573.1 pimeloyl-ACP methyl ester carboxylesterase [Nonomuraea soli]
MTQFLQVPGGTIAFDDNGSGPLVVLLPGMLDSRRSYRFLAPLLVEAGYRVVTMDIRGCGESSAAWDDYSFEAQGGDIPALLRHLDAGPAVLVGNSYSAGTIMVAAAEHPGLVAGVVPIASFVPNLPEGPVKRALLAVIGRVGPYVPSVWGAYLKTAYPSAPPADFGAYRAASVAALRERRDAARFYMRAVPMDAAWLDRVTCPALVMMGTADPDFSDPTAVAELQAATMGARLSLVEGAGHYPQAEFPAEVAAALLPFLTDVTSGNDAATMGDVWELRMSSASR